MRAFGLYGLSKSSLVVVFALAAAGCSSLSAPLQSSTTYAPDVVGYELCTRGVSSRIPSRHGDGQSCRRGQSFVEIY
jgi:hypothetical protein